MTQKTETWRCIDHSITLTTENKRRTFETPQGSIKGMPPCRLLTLKSLVEGKIGDCQIDKVS